MEFYNKKRKIFNFNWTVWVIIVNVILFVIFTILIAIKILSMNYIALNPLNILSGKYYWTFLTSMFMHAGFFHLLVNMISLVFVGSLVEKLIGKRRYLLIYLLSGLSAGVLFILSALVFKGDMTAYAVGASGAIFGLIGLLVILTPNLPVYIMFIPLPVKMKYAGPAMLILLWVVSIAGNISLGNFAHLGGLIFGLLYGLYLRTKFPNKIKYISKYFS
jgi:membrane associated rhomboid family serine protease